MGRNCPTVIFNDTKTLIAEEPIVNASVTEE